MGLRSFFSLFALLGALCGSARADVVELLDGSVLNGTVKRMEKGLLVLETDAAEKGEIKLQFEEIKSLTIGEVSTVVLTDGTRLKGSAAPAGDGLVSVESVDAGTITVEYGKITSINPTPLKPLRQKINLSFSARITDGNTRTKSGAAVGDYEARTEKSRLSLRGDWNYAEDDGDLSARNASGSIKYDYFITHRFFAYTNALFEGDDFADLNLRTTLGAGVGYQFLDAEDGGPVSFYEEVGISFFDEDFDNASDDRYVAGRLSGKFDWAVSDSTTFFHFHEFYSGFEDQDDLNADLETGLRFKITGNFIATAQVNFSWDNTPSPGNRRNDTEYLFGLGYSASF